LKTEQARTISLAIVAELHIFKPNIEMLPENCEGSMNEDRNFLAGLAANRILCNIPPDQPAVVTLHFGLGPGKTRTVT